MLAIRPSSSVKLGSACAGRCSPAPQTASPVARPPVVARAKARLREPWAHRERSADSIVPTTIPSAWMDEAVAP